MAQRGKKAVSRIRTFNADVSSARGEEQPNTPQLKKEQASAQDTADAILKAPKENVVPEKAKKLKAKKRTQERSSHEFLSANTDIPPLEAATTKNEALPEKIPSAKKLNTTTTKRPKEIKVASSTAQKIKVDDKKLQDEFREIGDQHTNNATFEDASSMSLRDEDDGAVIIQNKKHDRFKLVPAIKESLFGWAKEKKAAVTSKPEPQHVVNKAESRIETIARAAQRSYHPPQNDHGIIVKRLTKNKRPKKTTSHTIKKREEITAPSWTHVTEEAAEERDSTHTNPVVSEVTATAASVPENKTTESETANTKTAPAETNNDIATDETPVDTQLKNRVLQDNTPSWEHSKRSATDYMSQTEDTAAKSPETNPNPTTDTKAESTLEKPTEPETPSPTTTPNEAPALEPAAIPTEQAEAAPVAPAETVAQEPETGDNTTPVNPAPTTTPSAEPTYSTETTKNVPPTTSPYSITPENTASRVPIYIYSLVILGASLLGIGTSIFWFMSSTDSEPAVTITIPTLVATNTQIPVALGSTRSETYDAILDASLQSRETNQIYPTIADQTGNNTPADAQTVMQNLAWRAPGSFTRAIREITFGSVNGTDPFIVIRATNFDTAFAGMLQWEQVMSTDLAPLFGLPVSESYDPYARTDTQVRSAFFRDTIASNKSARMLVDANNTERILYSFVNQNTILITTNSETFTAVLPLIKK